MKMEFERQYDEFGGKSGAPQGKEECLMLQGYFKSQ
jgi:hypothetical protein